MGLGVSFRARVRLRIREWPSGMPRRLLTRGPNAGGAGAAHWWPFGGALSSGVPGYFGGGVPGWAGASGASGASSGSSGSDEEAAGLGAWDERLWLRPRSPLGAAHPRDVSFDLLEGDFAVGLL